MLTTVVVKGAADRERLRRLAPGINIREAGSLLSCDPALAARAEILVLRSGVRLDSAELDRWPALRHVVRAGSGLDGIDTTALANRGIGLHRNPHPAADAVAQWTLAALLSVARRIPLGQAYLRDGQHAKALCLAKPLDEMNLAIWGAGPVGRACAQLIAPHVAEVAFLAYPSITDSLPQHDAAKLCDWADAHIVALPLTLATMNLIGSPFLRAVAPRSPLLVCVGRLGTLDLDACLHALAAGTLSGLAIDPIDPGDIAQLPDDAPPLNLLATPHIGAQCTGARRSLDLWVATLLRTVLGAEPGEVAQ